MQMRETHMILAWVSVTLFAVRGLAYQLDIKWAGDSGLQVIVFGVDTLMTCTGLSLWVLMHFNPMRDTWLLTKLLALAGYTVLAHVSMWRGQFTVYAYVGAIACLAYMLGVSYTRSAALGLF